VAVVVRFETSQAEQATKKLTGHVNKLDDAAKAAQGSLNKQGKAASAAGAGTAKLGVAAKIAAPGVRALGTAVKAALGPVGLLLSAAGAMTQAFQVLAQQDFAEAKVRSLGVNSDQLTTRLKGVSRELAGQASVVELTSAAYDVASAGFTNAADAAGILKAASQGATGGFSDINTVGDATTSVLNAYGLEADKAAKLVDGFIQTQNDGKIVIGQYAANIAKVAPVAAALGVPLEEVNAAVAQITAGGQGAEVTFTALKTAFAQVAAGKVGEEFKKLGVNITASTLKSDGLAGTLEKIKKSGADAGTVIKAFGTEAGPSILALLNDTEKFNRLLENQKNSQGAAAKAAFEASDTIQGSIKRLQTAFSNLFADGSEIGLLLKSVFKVAAVTVEVFAMSLKTLAAPFRAIFAAVNGVGQAISEVLGLQGVNIAFELEQAYQNVLGVFTDIQNFIVGLGVRFGQFIGGIVKSTKSGAAEIKQSLVGGFTDAFNKIVSVVQALYNKLPGPVRFILEKAAALIGAVGGVAQQVAGQAVSAVTGFVSTTVQAGSGVTQGGPSGTGTSEAANGISPTGGALGGKGKERDLAAEALRLEQAAFAEQEKKRLSFEQQVNKLHEQQALQRAIIEGNVEEVANAFLLSELHRQHGEERGNVLYQNELNLQSIQKQVEEHKKLEDRQKKAGEAMKALYMDIGMTIKDSVVEGIKGAIKGTKSLRDVAMGLLDSMMNKLIEFAVNAALFGVVPGGGGGLFGGLFSGIFGGKRAAGGPVSAGKSYLVGEKGPELFTPSRGGSIVPNNQMGGDVNVNVNVDATGSSVEGNDTQANQLGAAIAAAVKHELIMQKRPGGLLS